MPQQTGSWAAFWRSLVKSFGVIKKNDPLRLAGATAFFTTFALPPILIILFQLFSLFLNRKLVGKELIETITDAFGEQGAAQIRQTARGFRTLAINWYIAIAGFLFLIFVATTLFSVIRTSLNDIWDIVVKDKAGIRFDLRARAKSLAIILVAGILFLCGIFMDGFEILASDYVEKFWPAGRLFFRSAFNEIVSIVIITVWFIVLFRYLADARPGWKTAIIGGCLTGLLFSIGKTLLSLIMRNTNITTVYGASGSIVLILLFVFYSSFILYFGASFIKVYAESIGEPFTIGNHAFKYEIQELSSGMEK
jgi:membrane protein